MADTRKLVWDILAIDRASKTFDHIAKHGEHMGGRIGKVGGIITGALAGAALLGVGALAAAFGEGLKQAADYEKITAQTGAVIKSTGGQAGVTAKHVQELGKRIEEYSAFSDEAVQKGENLLLTFTNIKNGVGKGNDIFDQSTTALYDMAQALGEDPQKAAIQLGKALNDPVKGITALKRVGVSFSEGQKKVIDHLVKTGHTVKAQKIILAELNKEFGGSAKAAGDTFAGSMTRIKNNLMDILRDAITPLLPYLTRFTGWLADKLPAASKALGQAIGWVKDQFRSSGGEVSKVTGMFSSLWGWVKEKLLPALEHLGQTVLPALKGAVKSVTDTLSKHRDIFAFIGTLLTDVLLPVIGQVASALLKVLGPAFKFVAWVVSNVAIPAIKVLISYWLGAVGFIIDGAAKAFGWVPGIGPKLKKAANDFDAFRVRVNAALSGIKDQQVNLSVVASINGSTKLSNQAKAKALAIAFRASGGPVQAGHGYVVGEEGPEFFVPGQSGGIIPNGKSHRRGGGGGGAQTIIQVIVQPGVGGVDTAKAIERELVRLRRTNGGRALAFQ